MKKQFLALLGISLLAAPGVKAEDRLFSYSYGAHPFTPGSLELETWVTWKTGEDFDRIDFRHELEWAVSERLQLGFYFADWRWQDGEGSSWHDNAIEAIYNLTNPNEHWIGSSLYGEVKFAHEFLELESKLLLQKNFGKVTTVYNATVEAEWEESGLSENKGEFQQTVGISYQFDPKFALGAEFLHEVEFDDWSETGPHLLYLGPNATVRSGRLWATLAGLWQVTGESSEPDFQLRTIVGLHF